MLFHAESNSKKIDKQIKKDLAGKDSRQYETYLLTHPVVYELDAIKTLIKLMKKYPLINVHIVHLSTAEALPLIRQARADGLRLTVETCYHYLYFNSEDIPDGSVEHKCAPPIRDSENNKLLWKAIKDGDIDLITSDHSSSDALTKNLEEGDFLNGWGGIASLGLGLPALHKKISEDTCENHLSLGELVEFLSHKPAILAGLGDRKGLIQKGYDADLAIFEPNATHVLQEQDLLYKNKISPYVGEEFKGRLSRTYLRGVKVYDRYQGGVLEPLKHRGTIV